MGDIKDSVASILLQSIGNEIWTALNTILSESANAVKISKSENTELKQMVVEANSKISALREEQEDKCKAYFDLLDNFNNQAKLLTELNAENSSLKGRVESLEVLLVFGSDDHVPDGEQRKDHFGAKIENNISQNSTKNEIFDTFESQANSDTLADRKDLYNCKYCSKSFSFQSDFDIHHKKMHIESLVCHECKKQYSSKSNLYLHNQSQHTGVIFQCNFCEYKGKQKNALKIHMQKNHNSESPLRIQNKTLRTTAKKL